MGSRLLLSAIVALATFGLSSGSRAAEFPAGHRASAQHNARHHHRFYNRQVGGYYGSIGGYRYGYENTPRVFSDAENYPGYYNNQTFWERVQTQRNYPVQY